MNPQLGARRSRRAAEAIAFVALIALASGVRCGRGSPTDPSPAAAVSSLALVPRIEQLAVGAEADLTLLATLRDGSTVILSPVWGTEDPELLLVKPLSTSRAGWEPGDKAEVVDHYLRGHLTALSPGVATVFADSPYGRGQQVIRVVAR